VEKMSLAVFNTQPPHLYFGGVERRILETGKRLSSKVNVSVYSGMKAGFKKPTRVNGLGVVPCFSTDALFPVDNWFFNHTLANSGGGIEADVYEMHNASGYAFLKALKKRKPKAPVVQTVHGVLADEYYQTLKSGALSPRVKIANLLMWKLSRLEAESARAANLVVAVSNHSSKRAVELYDLDTAKMRVVPNGVDPERFKPADDKTLRRKLGLGKKQVVLYVGRLIPRKGLHFLVEAAKTTVKERRDTVFVIVGDGPLRSGLTSELTGLGLSANFLFLGDVKENMLSHLYNCADVFALPSVQEGQGIVLLEAQASAKPVVAFNIGGVNEAVADGESGFLVERSNADMLGKAIIELLSDAPLRERMGVAGREYVLRNFTWDICAEKMLEVYREALGA
jgi:glycosyltransferase involved in cell wall biosynthesis